MWETVKTLRTIKNILWGVIVLIIIGLVMKSRSKNISSTYNDTNTSTQTVEKEIYNAMVTVDGGLNLRSEPNGDAEIIKSIPNNANIFVTDYNGPADTIDDTPGNWYRVQYKNADGWVWGNYVTATTE